MNSPISFPHPIPTHGNHRPIWPKFGEYKFLPAQRWLHNIEHGAVVMLYHPCTHPATVQTLRALVTGCIRKHIITPSTNLPEDRPLALVAWGCRMMMAEVDEDKVINFIREKGLKGPEVSPTKSVVAVAVIMLFSYQGEIPKEGQYTHQLLQLASPPPGSDMKDSNLCPNFI